MAWAFPQGEKEPVRSKKLAGHGTTWPRAESLVSDQWFSVVAILCPRGHLQGCFWNLVGRGQGCCWTSYQVQDSSHREDLSYPKHHWCQVEKPWVGPPASWSDSLCPTSFMDPSHFIPKRSKPQDYLTQQGYSDSQTDWCLLEPSVQDAYSLTCNMLSACQSVSVLMRMIQITRTKPFCRSAEDLGLYSVFSIAIGL